MELKVSCSLVTIVCFESISDLEEDCGNLLIICLNVAKLIERLISYACLFKFLTCGGTLLQSFVKANNSQVTD